jgi:hypothetical protein
MNRTVKIVLAANLIVFAILAFVYPHLMIEPGKLIPMHRSPVRIHSDASAATSPRKSAA